MKKPSLKELKKNTQEQKKPETETERVVQAPESTKKESTIVRISQSPIYIVINFIVVCFGALGGFAGLIQLISYLTDKPSFRYHVKGLYYNEYHDAGTNEDGVAIILSGTLENNGQKPLFINIPYELTVETPGYGKRTATATLLPSNMDTVVGDLRMTYGDFRDMETISQLRPSDAIPCTGGFKFPKERFGLVSEQTLFTVDAYDLNDKKYTDTFHFNVLEKGISGKALPEMGIKLLPRTEQGGGRQK